MKHKKKATLTHQSEIQRADVLPWLQCIIPPCLIVFFTSLVYYPSLHYAFQFDDIANISKHFRIRNYTMSDLFFSGPRWISYWLNSMHYSVSQFDPFSYRLFNVALHAVNGVLVFFIVLTLLMRYVKQGFFKDNALLIATVTALLFALHPVQTQTVSYVIQGELEGLAAFFIFSMIVCFLYARQMHGIHRTRMYCLLFVLGFLSSGTKEIAVISPVLVMLVDWFFVSCGSWRLFKKNLWVHCVLSCVVFGSYAYVLNSSFFTDIVLLKRIAKNNIGNIITHDPKALIMPWPFFRSQFKVIVHYLAIFVWPFSMSVEYDWMLAPSFWSMDCIVPLCVLLAIVGCIIALLVRNRVHPIAFGLLWFFIAIAPRSSIIPSPELLVDYKTYMASFGWLFVLASVLIMSVQYGVQWMHARGFLKQHHQRGALPSVVISALLLALPLGYATLERNKVWSDGLLFWENVIKNAPGKARAYNNYGVELSLQRQQYAQAIPYFQKAMSLDDQYADPCNNVAVAYAHIGQLDAAIQALKQGLKINPYHPEGYNNLASFLLKKKEYAQALDVLRIALKIRPHYGKAFFNMGRVYAELQEHEKAWECFKKCCMQADLDNEYGFVVYAQSSMTLKKYPDAIIGYSKALALNPRNGNLRFDLANAYYMSEKYDDAMRLYQEVIAGNPREDRAWYNLADVYMLRKEHQKAAECLEKISARQKFPQLPGRLTTCYYAVGNYAKAQKWQQIAAAMAV